MTIETDCTRHKFAICVGLLYGVLVFAVTSVNAQTVIHDWSELFASGYTQQPLSNAPYYNFTIDGQIPTLEYHFGFLKNGGYVIGSLNNTSSSMLLEGYYNGQTGILSAGDKPADLYIIEDSDEDGIIATLSGGNLLVDDEDRLWTEADVEFNGVQGAINLMPAYTGTSDTLAIPGINILTASSSTWQGATGDWWMGAYWASGIPDSSIYGRLNTGANVTLSYGTATAYGLYVGNTSTATFNHTGGTLAIDKALYVGNSATATGTLNVSGTADLTAAGLYVGRYGTGSVYHSAGTCTITGDMYIGYAEGSTGTYELSDTGQLNTNSLFVGRYGDGSFIQTGGQVVVSGDIPAVYVGDSYSVPSEGTYNLQDGLLSCSYLWLGSGNSSGLFVQTGGTCNTSNLEVGWGDFFNPSNFTGFGRYELHDGNLTTDSVTIGSRGTGEFVQTGGSHTVGGTLHFGTFNQARGTYTLSSGSLSVGTDLRIGADAGTGRFEWLGGTIDTPQMTIGSNGTLAMGYDFNVSDLASGSLFENGGTLSGLDFGTLEITNGATASQDVDLSVKQLNVDSGSYTLAVGKQLNATYECIGSYGTGQFTQNGGTNTLTSGLIIGGYSESGASWPYSWPDPTGTGTYILEDGTLNVGWIEMGHGEASGYFIQNGGIHTINYGCTLGDDANTFARYTMNDGVLDVTTQALAFSIGENGEGEFVQNGGDVFVTENMGGLILGYDPGSSGKYVLAGGNLTTVYLTVAVFEDATGTFTHTGGTNTVSNRLKLGGSGGNGTYTLSGTGSLTVRTDLRIGADSGTGRFEWLGGTIDTPQMTLGSNGTLAMGYDFNVSDLVSGALFENSGTLSGLDAGTLEITNGAAATQNSGDYTINRVLVDGGAYEFSGSTLTCNAYSLGNSLDVDNAGTFVQTGGTINSNCGLGISGDSEYQLINGTLNVQGDGNHALVVGQDSKGTFIQTGGSVTLGGINKMVVVGEAYSGPGEGTYNLQDGFLNCSILWVGSGDSSQGSFLQSGGTNTVNNNLLLGNNTGSNGTYSLSGIGNLSVGTDLRIGVNSGTGRFEWLGGTIDTPQMTIGSKGTLAMGYNFNVSDLISGALFENGGTLSGLDAGTLEVTNSATATQDVNLSVKQLNVDSGSYMLAAGKQLNTTYECIGNYGTAQFTQNGGTNIITEGLLVGGYWSSGGSYPPPWPDPTGDGTYVLNDGELTASWVEIGDDYSSSTARGYFIQNGGTHTALNGLSLGWGENSYGRYTLNDGVLRVTPYYFTFMVGGRGIGEFFQYGGSVIVNEGSQGGLSIGDYDGGSGYYYFHAGLIETSELNIGGWASPGDTNVFEIWQGSLNTGDMYVDKYNSYTGNSGDGTLKISNAAADITVSNLFHIGPNGKIEAVSGSTIHMTGADFENLSSTPGNLAGLSNLRLIFEGGTEDVGDFEVAGQDMGAVAAGWVGNFALGTLELGGVDVGQIRLVDDIDNQVDGGLAEALYVYNLVINDGAVIDLNGLNLYYLNGGDPKQFFFGDTDLDGDVDGTDLATLGLNWDPAGTGHAWAGGDFDGDGDIDGTDLAFVGLNWNPAGVVGNVPEPATMSLFGLGGLALLRRRGK